ncbi:unnamed protein product [Cyclocybe aegerita]|uniref:GH16 domain-containing protein n=1 Tax=Cyclocybe aegerita TaxID=1973307 RepID=A0A8S0XHK2_CYCAE|nr:unnamed protein product [Cyclocybe aegerita]
MAWASRPRRNSMSSMGSGSGLLSLDSRPNSAYGAARVGSLAGSRSGGKSLVMEKYSLGPSPEEWGLPLYIQETDDALHDPRTLDDSRGHVFTWRGFTNLGCLVLLGVGCVALFAAYPMVSSFMERRLTTQGGFNLGGINATGQLPDLPGNFQMIDRDTPREAYTKPSYRNPAEEMVLVFSDEFNMDGRTFYPGDDPFWEAVDLHYWGTNDLEWYDPVQATTEGGSLRLKIERANPEDNHNMNYRSGMIQSWNKFCFTGGILEASVQLPGSSIVSGLWPAVWAMGNLGRAGYGGSLEGMWPYSYDTCDIGTLINQTNPDGSKTPIAAWTNGDPKFDGQLSMLPGQKLSACTCAGEDHPGPKRPDGTFVGRAAPEIDVIEAIVDNEEGFVSLSAQWAPYNARYIPLNDSEHFIIHNEDTIQNSFIGGGFQQTTSGLARTNQNCYELGTGCYAVYAFEYKPGFDEGYITWVNDNKLSWTQLGTSMEADPVADIGRRVVSQEPMYIIANLGLSLGFGTVDFERLIFPAVMSVDYIRVYQPAGQINVGCDPKDFPTAAYIEKHKKAYTNANLTRWETEVKEPWPKNRLVDQC